MEFCRIIKEEYFYYQGYRFQKVDDEHAKLCQTGVVKKLYRELPVIPEEDYRRNTTITTKN